MKNRPSPQCSYRVCRSTLDYIKKCRKKNPIFFRNNCSLAGTNVRRNKCPPEQMSGTTVRPRGTTVRRNKCPPEQESIGTTALISKFAPECKRGNIYFHLLHNLQQICRCGYVRILNFSNEKWGYGKTLSKMVHAHFRLCFTTAPRSQTFAVVQYVHTVCRYYCAHRGLAGAGVKRRPKTLAFNFARILETEIVV